ncbi:zinc ribbon domain-containing protein [Pseudonocardia sp. WMMC193]|uniref:FmdB family zinc ribbon protein n=1 Tax=Pseudonocardia sp. WMMC193 TaxID=2911965 RepID=UPI001F19372A|nr:zinc ribbon domain-containing protein [Pseudonocardia sp. WMMC193]MCF7550813.1 zinc ribbon domain-containing protein [Pseudonocardia sp. WMMC193]
MILVDYRCGTCEGVSEHFVANPVPSAVECPACRAPALRRFAAIGLSGRAAPPADRAPVEPGRSLCLDNRDVPGLCHMTPDAGRAWVARARRDNRSLERELERQERSLKENPTHAPSPVSHDHGSASGTGHGHGHGHAPAAQETTQTRQTARVEQRQKERNHG